MDNFSKYRPSQDPKTIVGTEGSYREWRRATMKKRAKRRGFTLVVHKSHVNAHQP